jgi:hypothetical protein
MSSFTKAPSPGSSILSTSPSASVEPPSYPIREWRVIRPHVDFLHKLAQKHFPSLWSSQEGLEQVRCKARPGTSPVEAGVSSPTARLAALNLRIQETRKCANQADEDEDEIAEESARELLKNLKKEKKNILDEMKGSSLSLTGGVSLSSPSEDLNQCTPRIRAISNIVERLIDYCNREDRKTKKTIFRVIRCHNCSQASTGGTKIGISLSLPSHHVEWMTKVRMGCSHASVDKTLRILLEWYIAVFKCDCMMEYRILQDTEACRPDMGGFAMGLSKEHENHLHQRGRRPKGEADRALREQYEKNTPIMKGFGDVKAHQFHQNTYGASEELQEILYKLGRGC